jgi:predicted nuclease with TOPRIM domain
MDGHQEVDIIGHNALLGELSIRVTSLEDSRMEHEIFKSRLNEIERSVDVISERTRHYEDNFDRLNKGFELLNEKIDLLKERVPTKDEWNSLKDLVNKPVRDEAGKFKKIKDIALTVILTGGIMYILNQILATVFSKGGSP